MGRVVSYYCDIDGCDTPVEPKDVREYEVVFDTEQNEGRSTEPYFQPAELYLCDKHREAYMAIQPIRASGAMGFNKYKFTAKQTKGTSE